MNIQFSSIAPTAKLAMFCAIDFQCQTLLCTAFVAFAVITPYILLQENKFSLPDQQQVAASQTSETHDRGTGPNTSKGRAQAPRSQGLSRQGQGRAPPRRTGASRAGRASNTRAGRDIGSLVGAPGGNKGQAVHQHGQGTLAAVQDLMNQTQSGAHMTCNSHLIVVSLEAPAVQCSVRSSSV